MEIEISQDTHFVVMDKGQPVINEENQILLSSLNGKNKKKNI